MLVSLLFLLLAISTGNLSASSGTTEATISSAGAMVEVKSFPESRKKQDQESKDIALEDFKKLPKLNEEAEPKPPLSWTHSAIAIDADSGKILFAKDEKKKMPLASLTKMMSAIIIVEHISDWEDEVLISKEAAFAGGAAVHLKWDEKVKAGDLLKAMLMNSDNSAAIALAEHVAGSKGAFVDLMNKKAEEIGTTDSIFTDPSGLEDEKQHSTAYDMARITQYAMKNEKILDVMQTKGPLQITSCDGTINHRVGNTNNFLKDERLAPRVIIGKTGFTYNAGYNLMMAMCDKKKERKIIGVILNGDDKMRWTEMEDMLEWSFNNYSW